MLWNGTSFTGFFRRFFFFRIRKNIYAIADNKIKESGKHILLNGYTIPLITIKELIKIKNIIILISCADIVGVYNQLNQIIYFKETECFAVYFIRSLTNKNEEKMRKYPSSFRITAQQQIPKKIHYCWFGKGVLPKQNRRCIESWKRFCPEYEIIRWDEDNYDITKNRYMYEAYLNKKWGFVSDYARLDIIYHHGGIYLDTDVEIIKSYNELLYQSAFCGVEANRRIAIGLGFGAKKVSNNKRIIKVI